MYLWCSYLPYLSSISVSLSLLSIMSCCLSLGHQLNTLCEVNTLYNILFTPIVL